MELEKELKANPQAGPRPRVVVQVEEQQPKLKVILKEKLGEWEKQREEKTVEKRLADVEKQLHTRDSDAPKLVVPDEDPLGPTPGSTPKPKKRGERGGAKYRLKKALREEEAKWLMSLEAEMSLEYVEAKKIYKKNKRERAKQKKKNRRLNLIKN